MRPTVSAPTLPNANSRVVEKKKRERKKLPLHMPCLAIADCSSGTRIVRSTRTAR